MHVRKANPRVGTYSFSPVTMLFSVLVGWLGTEKSACSEEAALY